MYDIIIIGGGPAGLTAGLYGARSLLKVLLLERLAPGGQVLTTDWVENYPGFPEGVSGFELIDRMKKQAEHFGLEIRNEEVRKVELSDKKKRVFAGKEILETKAVILCCGANWKRLGIEGEDKLIGKGVSYCATCDAPFYRDQEVAVIGGGDTALEEAIFLTRFAKKIYLIHRRDSLRGTKLLQERAKAQEKIVFLWETTPLKILGQQGVEGLELQHVKTKEIFQKAVSGVFVFIGTRPNSDLVKNQLELSPEGFVKTDADMQSSIPGIFAAGDVRAKLLRQISTAVGEGATAAFAAEKYLESRK
ncbi:MAG: thioredoxin-disulfide reductase [Desulfobacteraceae bacterium]|nr:MAG: thioredoxin-disulfide reductase [Desulfobacteraceae bacterium]